MNASWYQETIQLVEQWQAAANNQDIPRLLALSDPQIELAGPRGVASGHTALADWVRRAGAQFETQRLFASEDRVTAAQHGIWHAQETGEVLGEAAVVSTFVVKEERIIRVARYDELDQALQDTHLTLADEYPLSHSLF